MCQALCLFLGSLWRLRHSTCLQVTHILISGEVLSIRGLVSHLYYEQGALGNKGECSCLREGKELRTDDNWSGHYQMSKSSQEKKWGKEELQIGKIVHAKGGQVHNACWEWQGLVRLEHNVWGSERNLGWGQIANAFECHAKEFML